MKLSLALLLLAPPLSAQRLDPDSCWTCRDSWEHFGSGAGIDVGFHALFPHTTLWHRLGFSFVVGVVWEAGQADAARTAQLSGRGFGFSLKDLACDMAGALIGEAVWGAARKIR